MSSLIQTKWMKTEQLSRPLIHFCYVTFRCAMKLMGLDNLQNSRIIIFYEIGKKSAYVGAWTKEQEPWTGEMEGNSMGSVTEWSLCCGNSRNH